MIEHFSLNDIIVCKEYIMKKILAVFLLVMPLAAFAEEDFGVNVPQWQDFAPKSYVDVKEPKGLSKLNITTKYWYERRADFETSLSECKALEASDERFSCYEQLKVRQYKLNSDYNAKMEAQLNNHSSIPGMGSPTDNMLPIGGYLDQMTKFMPNEIR